MPGRHLGGRGRTSSCSFEVMPASSRPATVTFFSTPSSADETRRVSERGQRKRRGVLRREAPRSFGRARSRGEGARPAWGKAGGGRTEPRDQRRHDVLAFPHEDRGARVEHLELRVVVERKRPADTRAEVKGAAGARPSRAAARGHHRAAHRIPADPGETGHISMRSSSTFGAMLARHDIGPTGLPDEPFTPIDASTTPPPT